MKAPNVKFNLQDRPEFFKELRKRVSQHFKENNISTYANFSMKVKTAFMISLYFVPFVLMITGVVQSTGASLAMWTLMGFGMSGIGLCVMHDANHGSYSQNKMVNKALGYIVNFLGVYDLNWRIQHNVLHHSFTNIDGYDEDIKNSVFRLSPNQERKKSHRYQHIYAPFLYGIMTLYWVFSKDFEGIARYRDKELLDTQNTTYAKALREIIITKGAYVIYTLILPMIFLPVAWWVTALGFFIMHFICGLLLTLVFQPAHVIEDTEFFVPDENSSVENSWAVHQMKTTTNFGTNSAVFTWLVGGLNHQIEHHLFPNICHIHYRKISKIVKATAEEYHVPYYQYRTFYDAVKSHFILLEQLGKGVNYRPKLIGDPVEA